MNDPIDCLIENGWECVHLNTTNNYNIYAVLPEDNKDKNKPLFIIKIKEGV